MKNRFLLFLMRLAAAAALASIGFAAGAALAEPVRINGKTLDEVADIMTETNHGVRAFPKSSLLVFRHDNAADSYGASVLTLNADGTLKTDYPLFSSLTENVILRDDNGGLYPALSQPDSSGARRVFVPALNNVWDGSYCAFKVAPAEGGGVASSDARAAMLPDDSGLYDSLATDAQGGLFTAQDAERELFAATFTSEMGKANTSNVYHTSCVRFFRANSDGSFTNLGSGGIPETRKDAFFPTQRIAVGDFDGDGVSDEIALVSSHYSRSNYRLYVYKVSESGGALATTELFSGYIGGGADFAGYNDGCAAVAGDFDGDGKTEIAAVMNAGDPWGALGVQIYKWDGSTFQTAYYYCADHREEGSNKEYGLSYGYPSREYKRQWGLNAVAADLDGDGQHEIVTLAAHEAVYSKNPDVLFLTVWTCDKGSITPKTNYYRDLGVKMPLPHGDNAFNMPFAGFNPRSLSLVAAPLTGTIRANGFSCDDIAFSLASTADNEDADMRRQRVYIVKTQLDSDGKFAGFSDAIKVLDEKVQGTVGLAAADFAAESARLDAPVHTKNTARRDYAAIIQTPPYHVDFIQAPWSSTAPTSPTNFSYMGAKVTYTKSETGEEAKDTKFETKTFTEQGRDVKAGVQGTVKKLLGFSFGANASEGFKDTFNQTASTASSSASSVSMTMSATTGTADSLMYYRTDMHVWRYPISKPAPDWVFGSLIEADALEGEANGDAFVSFTMCDEPAQVQGDAGHSGQMDDYHPTHEEGNLFSYPTEIGHIASWAGAQMILSTQSDRQLGGAYTQDLSFSDRVTNTSSDATLSKHVENHTVSMNAGLFGGILSGSWSEAESYGTEVGDSSSFRKTYSNSEKITVAMPDAALGHDYGYVQYTTKMRAFSDAAGILTMGFAVDLDTANAMLWRTRRGSSIYTQKPDPALVLPAKYCRVTVVNPNSGIANQVWQANPDEYSATQIRGIRVYDLDYNEYVTSSLERGGRYRISVPLYNASFVAADGVTVALSYDDGYGNGAEIGRQSVSLGGWTASTENNKATVSFDWTADIPEGEYDFFVEIDPDGALDEIHEAWSASVQGGNNTGYHPFAVIDGGTAAASSPRIQASLKDLFEVTLNGMTPAEFLDYGVKQSEPFLAECHIRYTGSETLRDLRVELVQDMLNDDGTKYERLYAGRTIPAVFPGSEKTFSFMADPEKMKEARAAVADGKFGVGLWDRKNFYGWTATPTTTTATSSSGGCNAGFGGLALFLAALTIGRKALKAIK